MESRKKLVDEIVNHRVVESVYPSREALASALRTKKRFRIYLGIDPTGPHIHLGHLTNFLILRKIQELGGEVIFLIGDFTARIGDPTDKLAARRPLSLKEVRENYASFKEQAGRILDFKGKNPVRTKFNSQWLAKMNFEGIIDLLSRVTVQQMIERDMFQERIKAGRPISLHEFIYPLMQGYDSVAMEVDAEIGGADQTFNMLMGRELVRKYDQYEKYVITTKLLVNPETGKKVMNKSEGGLINLDDSPSDIFGKVMAISDNSMISLAELCTEMPSGRIAELERDFKKGRNPKDIKMEIAEAVTAAVYGNIAAKKAGEHFQKVFSRHEIPDDIPFLKLDIDGHRPTALHIVWKSKVVKSKSEARRLIWQGGFKFNGRIQKNPEGVCLLNRGNNTVKIGKRHFFKIHWSG